MIVFAHAARIRVNHIFELRQLIDHFDDFIDLLLILGNHKGRVAMVDHERNFI